MFRIRTPTRQLNKFGLEPTFGYPRDVFTNGNPQFGTPSTQLEADFFDIVQEEVARVIELSGEPLLPGTSEPALRQLYDAINRIAEGVRFPEPLADWTYGRTGPSPGVPGAWHRVPEEAPIGTGRGYVRYEGTWQEADFTPPSLEGFLPLTGGTMHGPTGAGGVITFGGMDIGAPGTPTEGRRLVLFPGDASNAPFTIGMMPGAMYLQVRSAGDNFIFYGATAEILRLDGTGALSVYNGLRVAGFHPTDPTYCFVSFGAAHITTNLAVDGNQQIYGQLNTTGGVVAGSLYSVGAAQVDAGLTVLGNGHVSGSFFGGSVTTGVLSATSAGIAFDLTANQNLVAGAAVFTPTISLSGAILQNLALGVTVTNTSLRSEHNVTAGNNITAGNSINCYGAIYTTGPISVGDIIANGATGSNYGVLRLLYRNDQTGVYDWHLNNNGNSLQFRFGSGDPNAGLLAGFFEAFSGVLFARVIDRAPGVQTSRAVTSYGRGLDVVRQLNPISYAVDLALPRGVVQYQGLSGSEVAELAPELAPETTTEDGAPAHGVDVMGLIMVLINATKELANRVETLEGRR
jgi:hypothetical protein